MIYSIFLQFDSVAETAERVYDSLQIMCQSLAGIFGLVGGLRIFNKWQLHGRHLHIDKELAGWFGASIFFMIVDVFISTILL